MKIRGLENVKITTGTPVADSTTVQDVVPEINPSIPGQKPALMPLVKDPVLRYNATKAKGRSHFQPAEYDLSEIGRIEDTDGYVKEAFLKKAALMFKEGWTITGPDLKVVKYIKARLAQIARASSKPTELLFRELGSSLTKKSNAFIIKVRDEEASGGRVRNEPKKKIPIMPVAGYFIAPAETMQYQLSGNKIVAWEQKMPNGDIKTYPPQDVVHIYYNRKDGFVFGTPTLIPVIDDVRALRKIEENIELLVYQHLFPLFQYIVGTENAPAGVDEEGNLEIDVVKREIQYMPTEGSIVTPERHEIRAIGAEGRAIRAEGYIDHFKKRVFAGLGVSAVDMGEGETANRATADNMSRNLIDAVKDLQQILEAFINEFIIGELLLESTFGASVLDENMRCYLRFKEIDIDAQIKKEAHHADQFAKDVTTWDETRTKIGYEPIRIPTRQEMDSETDTAEKYPEWHRTRWKLFKEPELLIQSLDEPFSPTAKAVARSQSLEPTSADMDEAGQAKQDQEVELEKERTKAKVAVAKAKPKVGATRPSTPKRRDGFLRSAFSEVRKDIIEYVAVNNHIDHDWVAALIRGELIPTIDRLIAEQVTSFQRGFSVHSKTNTNEFPQQMAVTRSLFRERAERYIVKLTENVISSLRRNVTNDEPTEVVSKTRAVFDALKFRAEFVEDVEIRKAYSFGLTSGAKVKAQSGEDVKLYSTVTGTAPCDSCAAKNGQLIEATFATLDDLPPYHANCQCVLNVEIEEKAVVRKDSKIDDPSDYIPTEDFAECPKCGKTAVRKKDTPDVYNCRACLTSFKIEREQITKTPDEPEEAKDSAEVEPEETTDGKLNVPKSKQNAFKKCVMKTSTRLRAQHPNWDESKIEMVAEAACDHHLQNSTDDEDIEDGKLERCVLKVKKQLRSEHPDWSADKVKSSAFAICNAQLKGK